MHENVIDISTEVFHLLQRRAPGYVAWAEEKPGPTQKIVVEDDVYSEFVDRAISHRQTLDEVVRAVCTRPKSPVAPGRIPIGHIKHVHGVN
jgi:hypothetical protein